MKYCYGDEIFNNCVPVYNQIQVIHQATATHLLNVLFVTSKIEEGIASIVKIVIIKFKDADIKARCNDILHITKELIDWIYEDKTLQQVYLVDSDFLIWMDSEANF